MANYNVAKAVGSQVRDAATSVCMFTAEVSVNGTLQSSLALAKGANWTARKLTDVAAKLNSSNSNLAKQILGIK